MPKYVLGRTYTLAGNGFIIDFKKGQPVHVPPEMEVEAVKIGAEPVDGNKPDMLPKEEAVKEVPEGTDRKTLMFAAFEEIVKGGVRESFTGQGIPTVKSVEKVVGFDTTKQEIDTLFREFKQAEAAAAEEGE